MGFAIIAKAEPQCDVCGIESEPCEMGVDSRGSFHIENCVKEMRDAGWVVDDSGHHLICPDCNQEQDQ